MKSEELKMMHEDLAKYFAHGLSDKDIADMFTTMEKHVPGMNAKEELIAIIRDLVNNPIKG